MSLPSNPLPAPDESQSEPLTMVSDLGIPLEPVPIGPELAPPPPRFPAWSWWDVLAILGFTLFAVFVLSMIALAIAHHVPALRGMPLADLATDARIVVGAQAAAYPLVLIFMFILARIRAH